MKRYGLPFEEISIHIDANLQQPGRVELQKVFDTDNVDLQSSQQIISIDEETFTILDLNNPDINKIINVHESLPVKSITISVVLSNDFIGSKEIMGAIIAHEISHLYLYFNGLQKFNSTNEMKDLDECFTDITAFAIGLGIIMLNGCGTKKRVIHKANQVITETTRLGYLSPAQMKFTQEHILARPKIKEMFR